MQFLFANVNYIADSKVTKRAHVSNAIVLMILVLSLTIFIIIIFCNGNSIPKATASLNETASIDISSNNNKTTTTTAVPINLEENVLLYEAKKGNLVSTRVPNVIGEPQLEYSIVENGTITGIGNVTNIQTWIDTLRTPKVIYGEGKGVMITDDGQRATWIGYDIGQLQNNGSIIYKGITIFNNNATGDMAFLNNLVGLHITTVQDSNQATKIWKWQ
jgi:hypothetical protein